VIPTVFPTAAEGIAHEEALFGEGRRSVLLWQAEAWSLIVPRAWARRDGFAAASDAAAKRGWPLLVRSSGGGAVPQGPSTLNLAIVTSIEPRAPLQDGYRLICSAVAETLARFGIATNIGAVDGAFCDGAWNVTAGGRKLAGTAQRWRPGRHGNLALIQAAILVEPLPKTVWPALERVHRTLASTVGPRPEAHVTLTDLRPARMRAAAFCGALIRAAEDGAASIRTPKSLAA